MGLKIIVHHRLDDRALADEWGAIAAHCPTASLFTSFEWCHAWAQTVGRGAETHVMRFTGDGKTLGILPACVCAPGRTRWLSLMGRDRVCGDHLGLLYRAGAEHRCLEALTTHLDGCRDAFDGVVFGELDRPSALRSRIAAWGEQGGHALVERDHRIVPYIDLPASFDEYLASRSKKMRGHVRRGRRDLARVREGASRLHRATTPDNGLLQSFFALHDQRWRQAGAASNFANPEMAAFLHQICAEGTRQGWFRAYEITAAGQPQAVLLAFHWRGTAYFYQIGRRPESPLESPGLLAIAASIEQATREGITRYDFLQGNESYKRRWTNQRAEQNTIAVAWHWRARAALATERSWQRVRLATRARVSDASWERARRMLGAVRRPLRRRCVRIGSLDALTPSDSTVG